MQVSSGGLYVKIGAIPIIHLLPPKNYRRIGVLYVRSHDLYLSPN
jgi:hypothetical protein